MCWSVIPNLIGCTQLDNDFCHFSSPMKVFARAAVLQTGISALSVSVASSDETLGMKTDESYTLTVSLRSIPLRKIHPEYSEAYTCTLRAIK